jgi:hypothetical protein
METNMKQNAALPLESCRPPGQRSKGKAGPDHDGSARLSGSEGHSVPGHFLLFALLLG